MIRNSIRKIFLGSELSGEYTYTYTQPIVMLASGKFVWPDKQPAE